jgi:hypothetical protein
MRDSRARVDWYVHEDGPSVDQVKRGLRKVVHANVVTQHLNVSEVKGFEEAHLQISGDDPARRSDEPGEPPRHRPAPPAYLKTAGACADPETLDATMCQRIKALLE